MSSRENPSGEEKLKHQHKRQKASAASAAAGLSAEADEPMVVNYCESPIDDMKPKEICGRILTPVKYFTGDNPVLIGCDAKEPSGTMPADEPSKNQESGPDEGNDPLVANYGDMTLNDQQPEEESGRRWTQ
ncbi:hypothetical protein OROHE_001092 [Orobanche hederae]